MPSLLIERLQDIEQQSLARCAEIALPLVESMLGTDGRTYGDVLPSREDRIARFEDMAYRGVIDILQVISVPTYVMLIRDFIDDVLHSPLFQPNPLLQTAREEMDRIARDAWKAGTVTYAESPLVRT